MNKRGNILFINPIQFGYTAGYYHYCKYLIKDGFSIDYVCIDNGLLRVVMDGINVTYIKIHDKRFNWRFLFYYFLKKMNYEKYNVIILNHHRFAFLYRLFGVPARTIIDIRTGDLSSNSVARRLWNWLIKFDSLFYDHITILSESLRINLKVPSEKCTMLPLGADIISSSHKQFNDLCLLYVGTLYKRNICETIKGVALFLKNNPSMNLCYDIIGFGNKEDIYELQETINNESLQGKVIFHGRKNYTELSPFFEKSNVGISYIPIVPYYDCQPATKTFEYILSGMVCIATSTYENKKLINNINGVLCNDNPESFARALEEIKENKHKYNSEAIRETLMNYTWENIIHNVMIPTLEKINSNFK